MISDAALLEAVQQGVTVAQLVAMILADRNAGRAKRAASKAARAGEVVGQGGRVESGLRVPVGLKSDTAEGSTEPVSAAGLEHPRVKLAVARKAVPFIPIKGDNAKQVLAALLDFCHTETLRCYPGMEHLALKLGRQHQIDPGRHIRRGLKQLVKAGLLKVAKHSGLNHSNAYFPQWDKLAAIAAQFESGAGVRQSDSPDKLVPQYQKKIPPSVTPRKVQRATEPDRRQRQLPLVAVVPQGMPREQAGLRVMQAIATHCRGRSLEFARQVRADISSELLEAAITAEVRSKGGGFAVILEALGPGPPGAVPEVSDSLLAVLKRG